MFSYRHSVQSTESGFEVIIQAVNHFMNSPFKS